MSNVCGKLPAWAARLAAAVRRMLDPHHASRAERLHAALAVLGKRVVMGWEDAA